MSKPDPATGESTLALLKERARQQGDLPGFARAVSAIMGAMRGEEDHEFNMTQTVLSDPGLTQKVLRLANSNMYSAFGQSINTVSKAVIVLGTEAIGHLALGLKLIDELADASPESGGAHLEMEKAVLAGQVARQVAALANYRDTEEAVVCSMLHSLGRMMATFYLADLWAEVQARRDKTGEPESLVAEELFGLTFEQIGRATAERWGLPKNLVASMRELGPGDGRAAAGPADWLAALSTMSAHCAEAMCDDEQAGSAELAKLAGDYAAILGVESANIMGAIETVKASAEGEFSAVQSAKRANAERRTNAFRQADGREAMSRILRDGLADMHSAVGTASASQMIAMTLETVFKGLEFRHALAFLRNSKESVYAARMSLGGGMQDLLPKLVFDDSYRPDVFHAALSSDRIIYIENARDPKFSAKLPQWWRDTLGSARSFIVLPLSVNHHPAGFLYGDWDDKSPMVKLDPPDFMLLNDMRALVVQAATARTRADPPKPAA